MMITPKEFLDEQDLERQNFVNSFVENLMYLADKSLKDGSLIIDFSSLLNKESLDLLPKYIDEWMALFEKNLSLYGWTFEHFAPNRLKLKEKDVSNKGFFSRLFNTSNKV